MEPLSIQKYGHHSWFFFLIWSLFSLPLQTISKSYHFYLPDISLVCILLYHGIPLVQVLHLLPGPYWVPYFCCSPSPICSSHHSQNNICKTDCTVLLSHSSSRLLIILEYIQTCFHDPYVTYLCLIWQYCFVLLYLFPSHSGLLTALNILNLLPFQDFCTYCCF